MAPDRGNRIALVFRGDRRARNPASLEGSRLAPIADALIGHGLAPEPAVYSEEMADEFRNQLLETQAVLVWVNPVSDGRDRLQLNGILGDVAGSGVWVSAHPHTITKMGTKEVLFHTRHLGWGSDTYLYRTATELRASLPERLAVGAPRVLKQDRGNGGIGVLKVQPRPRSSDTVLVQSAERRDDVIEAVPLHELFARCEKYFTYAGGQGRLVDQPFQPRIVEGIIRSYLVKGDVVGFCRQYPQGRSPADLAAGAPKTIPDDRVFGLPSAKTMFGPDEPMFSDLRQRLEHEWVPAMQEAVGVTTERLPALWDADFIYGAPDDAGNDTYVLSEINVSAVAPFPQQAVPKLAQTVADALSPQG